MRNISTLTISLAIMMALISNRAMSMPAQDGDKVVVAQAAMPDSTIKTSVTQLVQLPARDGSFVASLPTGWTQLPLGPNSSKSFKLSATNLSQDISLIVEVENAADIQDWVTWTNSSALRFANSLGASSSTPMQHIKVNGADALQGEVSGILNGAKFHYLITGFKTDKYYVFVKSWTFESEFDEHRNDLMQLPNDLHF